MRSFSGFYFFLTVFMYIGEMAVHHNDYFKPFLQSGTLFLVASIAVALIKPYQRTQNNILDSLLLAHIAVIFTALSGDVQKLLILNILLLFPFAAMILFLLHSKLYKVSHDHCFKRTVNNCLQYCDIWHCIKKESIRRASIDGHVGEQSLIFPNTVNIGITQYGAC